MLRQVSSSHQSESKQGATGAGNCLIRVEFLGLVNNVLGKENDEFSIQEGSTIKELLELMAARYGEPFKASVLRSDGHLRPVSAVYINNSNIETLQGLDTPLAGQSKISVVVGVQPDPGG